MSIAGESSSKPRKLGRGLSSLIGEPVPVIHKSADANNQAPPNVARATDPRVEPAAREDRGLVMVAVGEIEPNKRQPRRMFAADALDRLADSIKRTGMMQPVILRSKGPGRYELVAGERRWRAAKMAGLDTLPALLRDLSDEECAEWALVENVQREDLNAMEKAWAFRALAEEFGLTHAQIAERVGLDRSSVANLIRLNDLEERIKQIIASGRLNAGHGKALLAAPAGAPRVALAEQASDEGWTVRRLERAAIALLAGGDAAGGGGGTAPSLSPARAARLDLEKQLSDHLGTKVTITTDRGGQRGRMTIEFYGLDHFDGLVARMGFRAR